MRTNLLRAMPLAILALIAPPTTSAMESPREPQTVEARVRAFDRAFFSAFNTCDTKTLEALVAPDLEFFHDNNGVSRTRDKFMADVKAFVCGKFRRERVSGTLESWPLGKVGALYTGTHRCCQLAVHGSNDGLACQGEARFLHILEEREQRWVITRVVSYDHRAVK
jgi:ketosteroid isomerase-like protein